MTENDFRRMALSFTGAVESAHMGHPDFRIHGKIFATLGALDDECGMVRLTPAQQRSFIAAAPGTFHPCSGAWGKQGCTNVHLVSAKKGIVKAALQVAFEEVAAKSTKPSRGSRKSGLKPSLSRSAKSMIDHRRERVLKIVTSLRGATATPCGDGHFSLEAHKKRFGYLLVDHHGDGRMALNCKAARGASQSFVAKAPDRFHVPKYVGRHGWIGLWLDLPAIDWDEVQTLIANAYRLVGPKHLRGDSA